MAAPDDLRRHLRPGGTAPDAGRGLRALALRRPLTAFLVLVLPIGWVVLTIPALMTHGVLPGSVPGPLFALALTLLVMLPAALWVTSVTDGRAGVRALLARAVRWRFHPGWWATVLLALPVVTVAVGAALGRSIRTTDLGALLLDEFLALVIAVVVINLWEETVWAGFFQSRLERRHGLVGAALLTGLPFAAVHLPLLFWEDVTTWTVLVGLVFLAVPAPLLRLLIGVTMRGAGGSVLAIGILHASWNAGSGEDGVADDLLSGGQPAGFAVLALALVTVAAIAVVRPRLAAPVPREGAGTRGT